MQRTEFIDEIFSFFRCTNDELKKAYDLAFSVKESIDWDKLYRIVLDEAETRYLPAPKWFKERFYRCYKQDNYNLYNNDGVKVIVTLNDGYKYDFELWHCSLSFNEIRQKLKQKFSYTSHDKDGNEITKTRVTDIQFIKEEEEDEQSSTGGKVFA